ncbi:MAG: O-antigen ligase family protein [Pseudomonadota bacterium]|nr:O-antigen ligase family protein [Pseudomonadota bacterium]
MKLGKLELPAEKALFWLLLILLLWAPIPLGSNRVWAWSLLEVATFALVAAWLLLCALGRASVPDSLAKAWPAFVLLGLWLLHNALHILPMPPSWVAALSPEAARMQSLTDAIGVVRETMTLSVDPHASKQAFLKSLAYTGIFFLVLALTNNRSRVLALARVLVYAAVLHAIYAVLMHLEEAQHELFGTMFYHRDQASGTYPNRNHFAGYLVMMLAVGIGLLIAGLSDRSSDTWKRFFSNLIDWILSPKMVLRLSLCILVIALTTTHSRMGNTAFFSALLIAGVIGIAMSRHATRNTVVLLVSLVAIDLFIVGSWFGVEKLAKRLEETTMAEYQVREEPAAYTIPLIKDYPVFGSGPGSFYVTFPRYRPETIVNFYDYAHNDYAQITAESGLIGIGLLGWLVVLTLGVALRAQWVRRDPLMRGMSFACIMGVTAILIHSWVDFNLQIPANAVFFMVLLALGWISLHLDKRGTDVPRRQQ